MKRITALFLLAALLLAAQPSASDFSVCPPQDNAGRVLFAARIGANGRTVCAYHEAPRTPPCPVVSPAGLINTGYKQKRNGTIVCRYGTGQ